MTCVCKYSISKFLTCLLMFRAIEFTAVLQPILTPQNSGREKRHYNFIKRGKGP